MYEEALECFWKIRNIVRHDPQTLYQIGYLYQLMNDVDQASEWYFVRLYIFLKLFVTNLYAIIIILLKFVRY